MQQPSVFSADHKFAFQAGLGVGITVITLVTRNVTNYFFKIYNAITINKR